MDSFDVIGVIFGTLMFAGIVFIKRVWIDQPHGLKGAIQTTLWLVLWICIFGGGIGGCLYWQHIEFERTWAND